MGLFFLLEFLIIVSEVVFEIFYKRFVYELWFKVEKLDDYDLILSLYYGGSLFVMRVFIV